MGKMGTTLALATSLLLPGCSPRHIDCGYPGCDKEIMDCLKAEVAGVLYGDVCTDEGAQRLVEFAKKRCKPALLSYNFPDNFPDSQACQKDIQTAVNRLCE